MNDAAAIVAEAGVLLTELERRLHVHGESLSELRAAGVSPQRIASLYPFDWEDWQEGSERLAENRGSFERHGYLLLSHYGMGDVVSCISTDVEVVEAERLRTLASSGVAYETHQAGRLARLELAIRLLHVLACAPFAILPNRTNMFRLRTQDFLEDAAAFCMKLNERTELFEDSSF